MTTRRVQRNQVSSLLPQHKRMCKNMYLDALHKHGNHNNALSQKLSASKPWMLHLKQKCSVVVLMKSSHLCHGFLACMFLKLLCSTFDQLTVDIPEIHNYSGGFKHVTEVCDQFWILVLQNILCDFANSHFKRKMQI